jgi:hypothetical protein
MDTPCCVWFTACHGARGRKSRSSMSCEEVVGEKISDSQEHP